MESTKPLFHKSVLINEVLEYLNLKPGGLYIDATFGSGGHTRQILKAEPTCKVIGFDWDLRSLDTYAPLITEEFGDRFTPIFGSFAHLERILKKENIKKVDGILADFGTSQMQIVERSGFSIYRDTPLDMRMSLSHQRKTAADIVNSYPEKELARIFYEYGEERFSRKIAEAIVHDRREKRFRTTRELASLIERIIHHRRGKGIHPATRVFQALRIYVNDELGNIESFLKQSVRALASEGRLVCISFHSLEDRIVKQFFREKEREDELKILTKKPVMATDEELIENPSSRSAKLRAAAKVKS